MVSSILDLQHILMWPKKTKSLQRRSFTGSRILSHSSGFVFCFAFIFGFFFLNGYFLSQSWAQQQKLTQCEQIAKARPDAKITEIHIIHHDIFEPEDNLPNWFPGKTANYLHISTAEDVIRRELLFEKGDCLDPEKIRETRRNLRALGYFRDEKIECRLVEPDNVHVEVSLKETWSIIPIFEPKMIQVQDNDTNFAVIAGLNEQNLLGRGKYLSFSYRKGTEAENTIIEDYWRLAYTDPNILGSRFRLSWTIQDLERGEFLSAGAEHPYYSLYSPWYAGANNSHYKRKKYLILNGTIVADYEQENNTAGFELGWALKQGPPVVHRLHAFYQYEQQRVRDFHCYLNGTSGTPPLSQRPCISNENIEITPPPGRTFSYPGLSYRRLGVNYLLEERIAQFERHEDINIGNDLFLSLAYSAKMLGAEEDELIFSASDAQGYAFRKGHFFLSKLSAQGQYSRDKLENGLFSISYNHYLQYPFLDKGPFQHTLHWGGVFSYGKHLDANHLLSLGYDTGLRGYDRSTFTGHKLFRVSLEDRIFINKKLFKIFAIGMIIFWDSGYVWQKEESLKTTQLYDIHHAAGIGLRLAMPSMTGANILQINYGLPLDKKVSSMEEGVLTVLTTTSF